MDEENATLFSSYSYLNAGIVFFGYVSQSCSLQILYWKAQDYHKLWKISNNEKYLGTFWGMPLFSSKPDKAPGHSIITTLNLLNATFFAFLVSELSVRGYSRLKFDSIQSYGFIGLSLDFITAVGYENIVEYYWHRLLHTKYLYARFHKWHHYYQSPEPWDDMFIHPLESTIYYCILYAPPFVFSMHIYAFILYMIVMGICGILDHSGVKFCLPWIYDSSDHDRHHELFDVNFGFPSPYLDMLHGTYRPAATRRSRK